MLHVINNFNVKLLLVTLLLSGSLYGGTYDDNYSVIEENESSVNIFMNSNFEEIIRFNQINFDGGSVDDDSQKILDSAVDKAKAYIDDGKTISITIIGHTDEETNEDANISHRYALDVQNFLLDRNISEDITTVEYRQAYDLGYSDATREGKALSNRVMLSIYVYMAADVDSDKDGVFDPFDRCPNTPIGVVVDKHGCPIDSDKDGVADYIDECPDTPLGYRVDEKGCPIDSDRDGVLNYKDLCPDTLYGLRVDINGCPITQILELNFEFDSYEIIPASYPLIERFAKFMKENTMYKAEVVGHTDSIGKESYNMVLSQERAKSVMNGLINEGVEVSRLSATGRGELEPIADNHLKDGRKANRRIEVKLSF